MCFGNQHTFTWGSSTAVDTVSLSLRCACGAMSRGDIAPLQRLQADNAALKAKLATVAEERDGLRKLLNMLADRFDLWSWEVEQRWGKSWHDATDAEMAAQIRAALAAAEAEAAGE